MQFLGGQIGSPLFAETGALQGVIEVAQAQFVSKFSAVLHSVHNVGCKCSRDGTGVPAGRKLGKKR